MDDDDYSDLTDLDSDEYEAKPTKKGTKSKSGAHTGYRIKNALKVPRATTYTAQALHGPSSSVSLFCFLSETAGAKQSRYTVGRSIETPNTSEVRLPTQREFVPLTRNNTDVVWPESKMVGIVDSIFRNFYIPPIIFGEPPFHFTSQTVDLDRVVDQL